MAYVDGDPEELRKFSKMLKDFCDRTRGDLGRMRGVLVQMGSSSWTDSAYHEYLAGYEQVMMQTMQLLARFDPEQISDLRARADRLEAVHRR